MRVFILCLLVCLWTGEASAANKKLSEVQINNLANAIYKAEGGSKTRHPYGVLQKYRNTSPRQACINTIRHKYSDWVASGSHGDFIAYLGKRYCPVGASNDPMGLNRNWVKNVKTFMGDI